MPVKGSDKTLRAVLMTTGYIMVAGDSGISVSNDDGITWSYRNSGLPALTFFMPLRWLLRDASRIYVAGSSIIAWTSDEGKNWHRVDSAFANKRILSFTVSAGRMFVAVQGEGMYTSRDDGMHWTATGPGRINVRTLFARDSLVLASIDGSGILFSSNAGGYWAMLINGLRTMQVSSVGMHETQLLAGGEDGLVYHCELVNAITEVPDGWLQLADSRGEVITSLAVNDSVLFAGSLANGVFRAGATFSWSSANNRLYHKHIESLLLHDSSIYAATYGGGMYRSVNRGYDWERINNGYASSLVASAVCADDSTLYSGTFGNGVLHSSNRGDEWLKSTRDPANNLINGLCHCDGRIIAVTDAGVFFSDDHADTWSLFSSLPPVRFVTCASDGKVCCVGSADGSGLYLSNDRGVTWFSAGQKDNSIQAVAIRGGNLICATAVGVFHSIDGGAKWTSLNKGLSTGNVTCLAMNSTTVFAGTQNDGVWQRQLYSFLSRVEDEHSTSQKVSASLVQITPNPLSDQALLRFFGDEGQSVTIQIVDIQGRQRLQQQQTLNATGMQEFSLSTSFLASGHYVLRVAIGAELLCTPFVVVSSH